MSGYLQRLVESTRRPVDVIRPVLQPIFTNQRFQPAPTLEVFPENVAAQRDPRVGRDPGLPEEGVVLSEDSSTVSGHLHRSSPAKSPVAARVFEPLLAKTRTSTVVGSPFADEIEDSRPSSPKATTAKDPAIPDAISPRKDIASVSYRNISELDSGGRAAVAPMNRIAPAVRSVPFPERVASAASVPEEIEIHIGRIEVTAVAPPAPRKPSRKALNLEEYLKRSR